MPGIDDAVLRRRQLDLDKRTEDLQKYFERLAGNKMAAMPAQWNQLRVRLEEQVTGIYRDMGALKSPKNLKALAAKAERLEAYISQINDDLQRTMINQQAYTTGLLKHQVEKSYYMNAWAMEQAGKVTAAVPVLTASQVLGVLANPWLPDGANYSDRIRANTQLLAKEVERAVREAVTEGKSVSDTARIINDATDEGYFRAVRLARTELSRAAALGASYSYLQNQDVLDGKRWNATLDSKTAPKDAKNDGKLYNLDYDTPEEPGVPGQRIPNHPNCRCIWSPVLSALGVNDRERIASDDGKRTYTKARTYEEYAKERGLPDLNDRLLNDRLKSYLRPGEIVTDLDKVVRRWAYAGKVLQVPSPDWDKPPKSKQPPIVTLPPEAKLDSGAYQPAGSIVKANAWAKTNLGIDVVDYKGFALELANDVNKQLYELQKRYPQALPAIKFIGTAQARNKAFVERMVRKVLPPKQQYIDNYLAAIEKDAIARNPKITGLSETDKVNFTRFANESYDREDKYYRKMYKRKALPANTFAQATNETWGEQAGITYNEVWAKDWAKFTATSKRTVDVKWSPAGTESPASILTHEYAHQIDYYLRREAPDLRKVVIDDIRDKVYKQGATSRDAFNYVKENLSEYATKSDAEFFAEAFAEWIHNPEPRPIAREIGEKLDEALKELAKRKGGAP